MYILSSIKSMEVLLYFLKRSMTVAFTFVVHIVIDLSLKDWTIQHLILK